jgi:hypothetical protein
MNKLTYFCRIRSLVDHDTEHKQLASCNGNETVRYDLTFYAFNLDKNVLYVDPSVAEGTVPIDIRLNQISCAYSMFCFWIYKMFLNFSNLPNFRNYQRILSIDISLPQSFSNHQN